MKGKIEDQHKRHLQVIELYDLGLDVAGIAHVLGVHHTTVRWHINREKFRQDRLAEMRGEPNDRNTSRYGGLPHHRRSVAVRYPDGNREPVKP